MAADLPWTYLLSSQHYSSTLELDPLPEILSSFSFERSHIVVLSSSPASWLAQCGFGCLEFCVRPSQSVTSCASLTLCEASTCATRSCIYRLYLHACTICSAASLLSLFGTCICSPLSLDGWYADASWHHCHSQCHTLLNSCNKTRPPLMRSHLLQYRKLMLLHPQVLFPAQCYHAVHSAHKSLRLHPKWHRRCHAAR